MGMEQLQLLLVSLGMSNMSRPVGGTVAFSWRPRPAPNDINVSHMHKAIHSVYYMLFARGVAGVKRQGSTVAPWRLLK
ncbi:hypothetical protein ACLKA7_010014 [Drosophila subpalustris]